MGSVGSTGLGFGVLAISGGITSVGRDIAISTDSGRNKRNRVEDQYKEQDELNEEYGMVMKKQKVDSGPQVRKSTHLAARR